MFVHHHLKASRAADEAEEKLSTSIGEAVGMSYGEVHKVVRRNRRHLTGLLPARAATTAPHRSFHASPRDAASAALDSEQSAAAAAGVFAATRARVLMGRRGGVGDMDSDSELDEDLTSDDDDEEDPYQPRYDSNGLRRPLTSDHHTGKHTYYSALGAIELARGNPVAAAAVSSSTAAAVIGADGVSHFIDGLSREHVNLRHQAITASGATAIAQCLVVNSCIRSLDVGDNSVGDAGGALLVGAVAANAHITSLDLTGNELGVGAAMALSDALQRGVELRRLVLANNKIGPRLVPTLPHSLPFSPSLLVLDLSLNGLSARHGGTLAEAIQDSEVHTLNLAWNELGAGASHLVAALVNNDCKLASLNLSFNGLCDAHCGQLEEALATNNTLTELDLSHNRLGVDSGKALDAGLRANTTLLALWAGFNPLGAAATLGIVDGLATNGVVVELGLENTTGDGKECDAQVQATHERLQEVLAERRAFARVTLEYPPQSRTSRAETASAKTVTELMSARDNWSVKTSFFRHRPGEADAHDFVDTQQVLNNAFEADWRRMKIGRLVKNDDHRVGVKLLVKTHFPLLLVAFRVYSSLEGNPFSMGFTQYTEFRKDAGIENLAKSAELDNCFVEAKQLSTAGDALDGSLLRFEFVELIVRLALVMYPPGDYLTSGPVRSTRALLERHLLKTIVPALRLARPQHLAANRFRSERLYNKHVDAELHKLRNVLQGLFEMYSGRYAEPTDVRCFVSFDEWMEMMADSGMLAGSRFHARHAALAFRWAHLVVVQDGKKVKHQLSTNNSFMLTFLEFVEALCRLADSTLLDNDGAQRTREDDGLSDAGTGDELGHLATTVGAVSKAGVFKRTVRNETPSGAGAGAGVGAGGDVGAEGGAEGRAKAEAEGEAKAGDGGAVPATPGSEPATILSHSCRLMCAALEPLRFDPAYRPTPLAAKLGPFLHLLFSRCRRSRMAAKAAADAASARVGASSRASGSTHASQASRARASSRAKK